ncbi:MAG TPA: CDP-alcohol phosphatidyltransferase family protein [Polyangiaceae bacterium]|nr:CDP-alcohol phosphatidyltransferase family protein [Polyangiaceae bacterium]
MLSRAAQIYRGTRKKHDLWFNLYMMRPIAALVVAAVAKTPVTPNQLTLLNLFIFVAAAITLPAMPSYAGGLVAMAILEVSYCFDCADGMLARHRQTASKSGHLFDFFTDELKAVLLAGALAIRLWQTGGFGIDGRPWAKGAPGFLVLGIVGTVIVASAISLTNFVRRPEISGRESTVEAHYETVETATPRSFVARAMAAVTTFLRFLNHYPSHVWIFALADRLDLFLWMYLVNNLLYLGRGWLGLIVRFGRS